MDNWPTGNKSLPRRTPDAAPHRDNILLLSVCQIPACRAPGREDVTDESVELCKEHGRERRAQLLGWES